MQEGAETAQERSFLRATAGLTGRAVTVRCRSGRVLEGELAAVGRAGGALEALVRVVGRRGAVVPLRVPASDVLDIRARDAATDGPRKQPPAQFRTDGEIAAAYRAREDDEDDIEEEEEEYEEEEEEGEEEEEEEEEYEEDEEGEEEEGEEEELEPWYGADECPEDAQTLGELIQSAGDTAFDVYAANGARFGVASTFDAREYGGNAGRIAALEAAHAPLSRADRRCLRAAAAAAARVLQAPAADPRVREERVGGGGCDLEEHAATAAPAAAAAAPAAAAASGEEEEEEDLVAKSVLSISKKKMKKRYGRVLEPLPVTRVAVPEDVCIFTHTHTHTQHTDTHGTVVTMAVGQQAIYAPNWDGTVLGTVVFSASVAAAKEAASKSRAAACTARP